MKIIKQIEKKINGFSKEIFGMATQEMLLTLKFMVGLKEYL